MIVTKQQLLDLRNEVQKDLDDYVYVRKKHKLVITGEHRIMLQYVVDILNKLLQYLKTDTCNMEAIRCTLTEQNWKTYSYSGKSMCSEKQLYKRLQLKPSKKRTIIDLLDIQAEFLEKAAFYILTRLEEL